MTTDQFVQHICEHCGVDPSSIQVSEETTDESITLQLDLPEEESGRFIGFHGETLESLQRIIRVVFNDTYPDKKIILNINNYRQERSEKLAEVTRSVAARVLETKQPYTFQSYMPAHERFIVHTTLGELPESDQLESISEGEGRDRRLQIRVKGE